MKENLMKKKYFFFIYFLVMYFMIYYFIMKDNKDYIIGLKEVRKVVVNMINMLRLKIGGNFIKVFFYR